MTAAFFASALLLSAIAHAEDIGNDEVTLKNGGSVRGTVISSEPGTSVKILEMGQKQPRVIPWAQVSDVERGKYAPKPAAQPGPAGPGYAGPAPGQPIAPPAPTLGGRGVVKLHVESPLEAKVFMHEPPTVGHVGGYMVVVNRAENLCVSPCDKVIDGSPGQSFSIAGEFPTPDPFTLSQFQGDVTLTLKPGSIGMKTGAFWAILLGTFAVVGGAVTLPLAYAVKENDLRYAGIGQLAAGVPVLAGGIVLSVLGRSTYTLVPSGKTTGAVKPRYWLGEF